MIFINTSNILDSSYIDTFFLTLNHNLPDEYIVEFIEYMFTRNKSNEIHNFYLRLFQLRDIRNESLNTIGEKRIFYRIFAELYKRDKLRTKRVLALIPDYGCWKDMWEILKLVPELENDIFNIVKKTHINDLLNSHIGQIKSITLLAKWLPREKSHSYPGLAHKLARFFYPFITNRNKQLATYRKDVSYICKMLKIPEIDMCNNTWSHIHPKRVPKRCFIKNKNSLINGFIGCSTNNAIDRLQCKYNFMTFHSLYTLDNLYNSTMNNIEHIFRIFKSDNSIHYKKLLDILSIS